MKNKRAQSEVITTVLIILLVLAAVFIVYTAVRNMVTTSTETATDQAKCIGLNMQVNSASGSTVTVQRNAGGDEAKVTPVIIVGGAVRPTTSGTCDAIGALETATCTLTTALAVGNEVQVGGKYGETTCDGLSAKFLAT